MAGLGAAQEGRGGANGVVDAGKVLDEAPWLLFQKAVLLLVCFVILLDGIDTQTLSLALPAIAKAFRAGKAAFAPILAASFVAMAVGTAVGGVVGDRAGRRVALIGSTVFFGVGTLLGAACDGVLWLGVTRVVASVGLGAAMPNATAMVAEFTPKRSRTLGMSLAMSSVPLGGFVGGVIASQVLPVQGWRALFVLSGAIPLAACVLIVMLLPESVRYLISRGVRRDVVVKVLGRLGRPVAEGETIVESGDERQARASISALFTLQHRRDTLSLSVAFFCAIFATLALTSWLPSLLADAGYGLSTASAGTAMYSVGALFGALLGSALFGWLGSRRALAIMILGALLSCFALAVFPLGWGAGKAGVFVAFFIAGVFIPGGQVLLFSLAGQIFPTAIRATGVGFVASIGRVGAVCAAFLGPAMLVGGSFGLFGATGLVVLAGGISLQLVKTHLGGRATRNIVAAGEDMVLTDH